MARVRSRYRPGVAADGPGYVKAKAKLTQKEVGLEHPARGPHRCSQCIHFNQQTQADCHIVAGRVLPRDWCHEFASISGRRENKRAEQINRI